ncbi:MAG: restriction endonuclease subunit S [Candidatus Adiutrix sp.]|jgi:type I restriction enzyme S subunit|nr:restriction endonuclease subunit S [Candidatus Adiutrix sp.]
MSKWPIVKLGEIVTPALRAESPMPGTIYRQIGVRLWGEGAYERESIDGSQTKYAQLFCTDAGDIIVNKIWARNGSVAVVPHSLSGCFGSSEFPMFAPKSDRLESRWMHWLTKTQGFWTQCDEKSRGTSGKNRIKPEQFLRVEIPLPPLPEQRRIVARIEELAAQIQGASELRRQATEEAELLLTGEEFKIWPDENLLNAPQLESLSTFLARGKHSEQGESDHFLIKTQHVQQDCYIPTQFRLASHTAIKVKPDAIMQDGDILIACSAAGCLGRVARYRSDGRTVSTDTHVAILRPDSNSVVPDYLYAYLRGAQGQFQLRSRERGDWQREKIGFRLTELNLCDLRKVPVPVPPLPEQRRIVAELDALQTEVDALKQLQAETAADLDALLPAVLDRAFKGEL